MDIKANDPRVVSIDSVTNELLVRIDGELVIAYGERNLRGGYTYRVF